MEEKFKFDIGDVVQLKSGGPLMTINTYVDFGNGFDAITVWFTNDGVFQTAQFNQKALLKIN